MATITRAFLVELLPVGRLFNWYPHEGQLSAVSEIDFAHSGHAISAISLLLSYRTSDFTHPVIHPEWEDNTKKTTMADWAGGYHGLNVSLILIGGNCVVQNLAGTA